MKLFVQIHDPAGDRVIAYDGMDQPTVTTLQTFPFDFIDEAAYNAFVVAHIPVPPTPAQILAFLRSGALDNLNTSPDSVSKLQRAILMVILDEINVIRALLPGPPAQRTIAQMKTAIQNKINAGAAD